MIERIQRLSTEQRSDLVAYLDGELDEASARGIEHMLATSPVARNEVEVLTRTWELLDLLPRPGATEDFHERTMTTIRLDEYREPISSQPWFQQAMRVLLGAGWAAAVIAAAVIGFLATNRWIPHETEPLIQELPLIENLEAYQDVDSLDFLKDLARTGWFLPAQPDDHADVRQPSSPQ